MTKKIGIGERLREEAGGAGEEGVDDVRGEQKKVHYKLA